MPNSPPNCTRLVVASRCGAVVGAAGGSVGGVVAEKGGWDREWARECRSGASVAMACRL